MKTFHIWGGGFIFEKHLKAIKENGGEVVSFFDIDPSKGVIDRYFPKAKFTDNPRADYHTIITPNYTHYDYWFKHNNKPCIIEKPITIDIESYNTMSKGKVYPMMQLRADDTVKQLKEDYENGLIKDEMIEIEYNTYRGDWYHKSWKGDNATSGGLQYNIGIHLFDMLIYIFGTPLGYSITNSTNQSLYLTMKFNNKIFANISLTTKFEGQKRTIKIGDKEINFSKDFTNLHTEVYKRILNNDWFEAENIRDTMEFMNELTKGLK